MTSDHEKDHAIVKWLIDDKISVISLGNILLNDKEDEYKIEEVYHVKYKKVTLQAQLKVIGKYL
jgi:hypothetical protein